MTAAVVTFLLCSGIILGSYWAFVVRAEGASARSLRRRLLPRTAGRPKKVDVTKKTTPLSVIKTLDTLLARSGVLVRPLQASLSLSGLPLTVGSLVLLCVLMTVVTFLLVALLIQSTWIAALFALVVAPGPYWLVRLLARRRLQQLEQQFPEAIDLIAVSLRAGHAFSTALLIVADETAPPLAPEFRRLHDEQNYGKPLPDVLKSFVERVPFLDARIFVTAVLTQREAGGNLAEVLDKLSAVIRERFTVRRQVRAVSAHGRITGWVLAALPPALAAVLYVTAPDHVMTLVRDPLGLQITALAVTLQIAGTLAIRHIVRIEL
jgi:tight adherence protein B